MRIRLVYITFIICFRIRIEIHIEFIIPKVIFRYIGEKSYLKYVENVYVVFSVLMMLLYTLYKIMDNIK